MTKQRYVLFFNVTKRNRKSRKQMSNVWVVRLTCVSRVIETVCSVFMSVSVIHCNVCAYVVLHFHAMLEHYQICLWLQGLWKHVITNVISIAYCLVVLRPYYCFYTWCFHVVWWKLIFVSFHFWSIKSVNIDLRVWNFACLMGQWFLFNNQLLLN